MTKNNPNNLNNNKLFSPKVCFSFDYILRGCGKTKNKNFFFTNQVPYEEIKEYRIKIENCFQDWSKKTIKELESEKICYPVRKEKNYDTKNNLAKVFRSKKYPDEWINQNIIDPHVYKFKVNKQIRIFAVVERNVVHVLLYDIWHLINPSQDKNFSIPNKLVCTWCLKSCD